MWDGGHSIASVWGRRPRKNNNPENNMPLRMIFQFAGFRHVEQNEYFYIPDIGLLNVWFFDIPSDWMHFVYRLITEETTSILEDRCTPPSQLVFEYVGKRKVEQGEDVYVVGPFGGLRKWDPQMYAQDAEHDLYRLVSN
jgi:hypothetical protein